MGSAVIEPSGLNEPYLSAARKALEFIESYRDPVVGILLGGSLSRGVGDANSDLDFYVVTVGEHRQRIQRRFNGVPCEMFFNPERQLRRYFAQEAEQGKSSALGLTLDSQVLLDVDGVVARLREEARAFRVAGPQVPPDIVQIRKYLAVDMLDNARDLVERDPTMARILTGIAVRDALALAYVLAGEWIPGDKALRQNLVTVCPQAVEPMRRFTDNPSPEIAGLVLTAVFGKDTFFEWESEPEEI